MKRLFLLLISFGLIGLVNAQITVTHDDLPQAGKIYVVGIDTIYPTYISNASPLPQTWNYSTLINNFPKVASYSPTAPYQCYAPSFPGSNMYTYGPAFMYSNFYGAAPVYLFSTQMGYIYWKKDTAGFSIVGFRSDYGRGPKNTVESQQEILMKTPATFGDSVNNSARWVATLNAIPPATIDTNYVSHIYKVLHVDAFGTLQTVLGTFNVIRVHEKIIERDSAIATIGGTPVYGLELSRDTVNNYYYWTNGVGYPIASIFADKHNHVKRTEFLTDTLPGYSITGNVFKTDSITPVAQGQAQLIAKSPIDHLFGVPETVEISNGGHFQFADVAGGKFLILADAAPTPYPHLIPTYYGDSIHWQDALAVQATCDTNVSINMRTDSMYVLSIGNSGINGTVWVDTTVMKNAVPVRGRGVKITLEQNPGGSCYRHAYTDEGGNFSFTNLPAVDFTIEVEIAGLTQVSTYNMNLSAGDSTFYFKDFIYDSTNIKTYLNPVGISENQVNNNYSINISPNPFIDYTTINITSPANADKDYSFIIYDVVGKQIKSFNNIRSDRFVINRNGLSQGLYIYEIRNSKEIINTGKIIIE
jgi:hypothetical protein